MLGLRCTSVTLNTKKQAIDDRVQISQSKTSLQTKQFFFSLNKGKQKVSKLSTRTTQSSSNNQTINTPPNLKLTLSSMFKQMQVRTRYKSLNESTREKERNHLTL